MIAVPLVPGATQVVKAATPATYRGVVVRELSGAALVLRMYDSGSAASGTIVDVVAVPANGVVTVALPDGLRLSNGLVIERVSGTNYEGSVRLG